MKEFKVENYDRFIYLVSNNELPTFEMIIIHLMNETKSYKVVIEEWFEDCLESRDEGRTTTKNIRNSYLWLMESETGLRSDLHRYISNAKGSTYGSSYIMQKI